MKLQDKAKCQECAYICNTSDILRAPNPFDKDDNVSGCPECKSVDSFVRVCDEPGCNREVACGTPTPAGYRQTCGRHRYEIVNAET